MKFLASRRRLVASRGRPVTFTRGAAVSTVKAFLGPWTADNAVTPGEQGDGVLYSADDLVPFGPRAGDFVAIDGATWVVLGAPPVYDGPALIGYNLHIRGGQP